MRSNYESLHTFIIIKYGCCGSEENTVALLDLTIGEGLPSNIYQAFSNLVKQEFVKSEMFDIFDRGNMESILKEQNFTMERRKKELKIPMEPTQALKSGQFRFSIQL